MKPFDWASLWIPKWSPFEVALRAAIVYVLVQILIRLIGRKELGRYSTSDIVMLFLVTTAARQSIVGDDTSLTSAAVGLFALFALNWLVSLITFRSRRLADFLEGPVRKLIHNGKINERELRRAHISVDELKGHLRQHGTDNLDRVCHAFLERSGRVTFVMRP